MTSTARAAIRTARSVVVKIGTKDDPDWDGSDDD